MNTTTNTQEPDFTPEEVATMYSISTRLLREWRHEGLGPVFRKIGHRTIRYPAASTREYFEGLVRQSASG